MDTPNIKRTGEIASVGAVSQHWGPRPIGLCSCGKRVVSLQSKETGKWFLVDVKEYKNGRGYFYVGAWLHKAHK